MTLQPEANPGSANIRLADYLATKKEAILAERLELVHVDPAIIPTEILNTVALRNHLPEIFDDLTDTLRRYGSKAVAGQAMKDAEEHGASRWRQGYELPEMLRELKHLRAVVIFHMRAFDDLNPDEGMASRLFTSTTIHGFVDEMMIDATEDYLWAKLSLQDRLALGKTKC